VALLALTGMDGAAPEASATTPPAPVGRASRAPLAAIATIGAPVAVGLAPLTWLWAANRTEFELGVMVVPAIVVAGLALLLVAGFRLLTGRLGAASLLASATLVAIFAFGTELDVIAAVLGREPGRAALLVRATNLVALAFVLVAVILVTRRGRSVDRLARAVGLWALVLIVLGVVRPFGTATDLSLGLDGAGPGALDEGVGGGAVPAEAATARSAPILAANDAAHPDVYYVIFDGYARADALAAHYGFDNGPFLAELAARGFFVADRASSNYPYTYLSLASSLNERYLTDEIGRSDPYRAYLPLIRSSEVATRFRDRGYAYAITRTVWAGTSGSPIADEILGPTSAFANEYEAAVLEQSIFRGLLPHPSIAEYHLAAFDGLEAIAADGRPTFTLAHIILPHPPYVLDREGTVVQDISVLRGQWGGAANEGGYLEQVRFVNDRIIEVIDAILARSPDRPIIILQGDHGSWSTRFEAGVPHEDVAAERMSILNAYLVPDGVRSLLYPSITPVNTFRAIDQAQFGEAIELLPDESSYGDGGPPSNLERYVPGD
jgi:hypothetical protein